MTNFEKLVLEWLNEEESNGGFNGYNYRGDAKEVTDVTTNYWYEEGHETLIKYMNSRGEERTLEVGGDALVSLWDYIAKKVDSK